MENKFKKLSIHCSPYQGESIDYETFRKLVFTSIIIVASIFAFLFGLMHDLDINPISDVHAKVNYFYSATSILMLLYTRLKPDCFHKMVLPFLITSHITFSSALINVPDDQFRAIWFYLLVLVAYMLDGTKTGIFFTLAAIFTILFLNSKVNLYLTDVTLMSIILGLVILSLIARAFTKKATMYARLVEDQNIKLIKLAREDSLTGILNARSFYEIGSELFKISKRENKNLSILYLDLDHFKKINDDYGHHNGDKVLKRFTEIIESTLRDSDVFARIGGEEFNILLPGTDLHGAEILAEKIRQQIETSPINLDKFNVGITCSIGVSSLEEHDRTLENIQMRADKHLYIAKRTGRNCVIAS